MDGGHNNERPFKVSEAARLLGVSADWLREAERRGVLPPARRDFYNGHRLYTAEDLDRLRVIGVGTHPRRLRDTDEVLVR
jgi:DNA-binding transcriptional MerR regulator